MQQKRQHIESELLLAAELSDLMSRFDDLVWRKLPMIGTDNLTDRIRLQWARNALTIANVPRRILGRLSLSHFRPYYESRMLLDPEDKLLLLSFCTPQEAEILDRICSIDAQLRSIRQNLR